MMLPWWGGMGWVWILGKGDGLGLGEPYHQQAGMKAMLVIQVVFFTCIVGNTRNGNSIVSMIMYLISLS